LALGAGDFTLSAKDGAGCSVAYSANLVVVTEPSDLVPVINLTGSTLSCGDFAAYK
jgi:hypothetical protein